MMMNSASIKHNLLGKIVCLFFVVSLGVGEVVSFKGIKLSYVSTILFFVYTVFIEGRRGLLRKNVGSSFAIFLFMWVTYALVQLFWVEDVGLWFDFFRTLAINVLVVLLIINYVESYNDWLCIAYSFLFLILLCLLVGVWEFFTSQHFHYMNYEEMNDNTIQLIRNKPLSFFGNINDNSSALFLGLIVAIIVFFQQKTKRLPRIILRLAFLSLILVEIVIINARAITYSVLLLVLAVLYFYLVDSFSKHNQYKVRKIICMTIVAVLCVVVAALALNPIEYYLSLISKGTNYSSDLGRISVLRNGFSAFMGTYGAGLGAGQSLLVSGINLHSFYLEVLFEYGVLIGGYAIFVFVKMIVDKSRGASGVCDYVIRSFPIVLILAGVSSSKLFSLRPFWVTFSLLFILKYRLFCEKPYEAKTLIKDFKRNDRCINEF